MNIWIFLLYKVHWTHVLCNICMHKKFEIIIRSCKKYDHALKLKRSTSQTWFRKQCATCIYVQLEFHSSLEEYLTQTAFLKLECQYIRGRNTLLLILTCNIAYYLIARDGVIWSKKIRSQSNIRSGIIFQQNYRSWSDQGSLFMMIDQKNRSFSTSLFLNLSQTK